MSLQPGMQVGDYQILRQLGAGGMGQVFQVRNMISDRIEAMKVLLPDLAGDPGLGDRFLREIKVQAALDHPNIAGLRTAMRAGNQLLMLMEFVEGRTVGEFLAQGPVPVADAVRVCMDVLTALEYAHSRGIVHRDIKPSNIMITPQGQVKLMDFGIARVMNDPSLTQTHQTTGSLYYMSPEQINGGLLDGRSDLYSLAVSLYEMVTGKRPFTGENTFAIMAAHMQQAPVAPAQHDARVPAALSDVIVTGMAKDPNARFQTAGAFRAALANALQAPLASAPLPPAKKAPPPRTLYMLAGSLATVMVLAALATQAPKFFRTRAQEPVPAPVVQPPTAAPVVTPAGPSVPPPAAGGGAKPKLAAVPADGKVATAPVSIPAPAPSQPPAPAAVASLPAVPAPAPAVDRTAIDEQRKRLIQMAQRVVTAKAALQSLRESMAQQGLRPRAELQGASQRMQFELDQAEAALTGNDPAKARQHLDYAERALETLEKAFQL